MKKIITIIFTLALILCLAACGNDVPVEETQPKATVSDATKPEVTEPEATEPDVTEPDVTEPEATEPEVTDPPVTEKPHAHSYTSTTENATCDKDGSKVFTCECGDSYTEIITKLGHSYTDKVTAPTCTEKGYTTHTCTRCSDSYKDSYKDATNHSYTSKVTTAATCTKEGVKTFTCSKCANQYTESIAKTAHNYAAATCTKPKTCTCGATSGTALGHSYTSQVTTSATCTKEGVKTFTCSKCANQYTESIAKTAHNYAAATCTKPKTCTCGATSGTALGHSYTSKVTTAASCTKEGVKTFTCSKCANQYTESIAKTAHNYAAATCTKPKTCTCGATSGTALGHSYTSQVTTSATCTKEGVKTFTCSKCANQYTESIAKTAHNYAAATCTKPKTCTCGATSGSALGHSYSYAKNKAPTTSATGTLKGTCSRCSGTTSVTVPKLNTTDYTRTQTKAPTCTATGTYTWKWKTTTYGTFSYTTSIAAKGHSWGSWEITNYPTPVLEGKQERVCNSCSKKETQTVAKSKYDGTYHSNNDYMLLSNKQKGTAGFNIRYAWWENGELKIDGYFFNDTKSTQIFNSAVRVKIYGRNGVLIANGTFNLSHIKLNAKETGFHQLTFGIDSYSSYGCDLSYLEWAY